MSPATLLRLLESVSLTSLRGTVSAYPNASNVNVSGVQSTQLGHGETLAFWILFLNPSLFFKSVCKILGIMGRLTKSLASPEGNNLWKRLRVTTPSPLC